jgi:putative hydrolase of the HAD superfamily
MDPRPRSRCRAVLCDLDDTLFDHRHATRQALGDLRQGESALAAWPMEELEQRHGEILEELHGEVLAGRRTIDSARNERFLRLLEAAGADRVAERAVTAAGHYRVAYEAAWRPVPGARALLEAITASGRVVGVVTNNKVAEQRRKLDRTGLAPFVSALVTSEEVGVSKPAPRIFEVALDALELAAADVVMLGDAWSTDIVGAVEVGIRAVWFNPRGRSSPDAAVPEVQSLEPTRDVLDALFDGLPEPPMAGH